MAWLSGKNKNVEIHTTVSPANVQRRLKLGVTWSRVVEAGLDSLTRGSNLGAEIALLETGNNKLHAELQRMSLRLFHLERFKDSVEEEKGSKVPL